FSVICLILTIYILKFLFQKRLVFLDLLVICAVFAGYLGIGFLDYQANLIFLFFVLLLTLIFRFANLFIYFQIAISGLLILCNALTTFKVLQMGEIVLFQQQMSSHNDKQQSQLLDWTYDKKNRILANPKLPLYAKLPKDFFFHNPKDLKMKNRSGVGQLLAVFSIGDKRNPNLYPYVRLFLFTKPNVTSIEQLNVEFQAYLKLLQNQGDISEIRKLESRTHPKTKWAGSFWTFYDRLRPRYSKIGYYIMKTNDGKVFLIEIMDNLLKNRYHSRPIETILGSLTQSIHL
ncbi:MAG: hypothetical protein AAF518_25910, partial [Spirochaetota bacterium]